jgi:hypothetical protein
VRFWISRGFVRHNAGFILADERFVVWKGESEATVRIARDGKVWWLCRAGCVDQNGRMEQPPDGARLSHGPALLLPIPCPPLLSCTSPKMGKTQEQIKCV